MLASLNLEKEEGRQFYWVSDETVWHLTFNCRLPSWVIWETFCNFYSVNRSKEHAKLNELKKLRFTFPLKGISDIFKIVLTLQQHTFTHKKKCEGRCSNDIHSAVTKYSMSFNPLLWCSFRREDDETMFMLQVIKSSFMSLLHLSVKDILLKENRRWKNVWHTSQETHLRWK